MFDLEKILTRQVRKYIEMAFAVCLVLGTLSLLHTGKTNGKTEETVKTAENTAEYNVYFVVENGVNLMMAKYDIDLYVDDQKIGTVPNGSVFENTVSFKAGDHVFTVRKNTDSSVKASYSFSLKEDATLECDLKAHTSSIDIENFTFTSGIEKQIEMENVTGMVYGDALKLLNDKGFSNVTHDEASDIQNDGNWIVTGQNIEPGVMTREKKEIILICIRINDYVTGIFKDMNLTEVPAAAEENGYTSVIYKDRDSGEVINDMIAGADEEYLKNSYVDSAEAEGLNDGEVELSVYYSEPEKEVSFSEEYGFRAAVTALTNYYALDVFEDGVEVPEKFHSFADTSGNTEEYYMSVVSKGKWSGKSEDTWHCEGLKLEKKAYGLEVRVSLDVSFDGENYIITNIQDMNGTSDQNTVVYDEGGVYFTVPHSLVEEDRSGEPEVKTAEMPEGETAVSAEDYIWFLEQALKFEDYDIELVDDVIYIRIYMEGSSEAAYYAKNDVSNMRDTWNSTVEGLKNLTAQFKESMDMLGLKDYHVAILLMNDQNRENTLFAAVDGKVAADVVNDD